MYVYILILSDILEKAVTLLSRTITLLTELSLPFYQVDFSSKSSVCIHP